MASHETLALLAALRAAVMGPSSKVAEPRQTVLLSRLIVACQRLPRVSVGPLYRTVAQALEPDTCEPVQ